MLKKLHLENFKSWENLDLELSNLNFLFGTNSSGKTSILSSLLLLKQTAAGTFDRFINLGGHDSDYVDFGDYKNLVFGHDEKRGVGIRLEWTPRVLQYVAETKIDNLPNIIEFDGIAYTIRWQQHTDRTVIERLGYDLLQPTEPRRFLYAEWKEIFQGYDSYSISPNQLSVARLPEEPIPAAILLELEDCYTIPIRDYPESFVFSYSFEELMKQIVYLGPLRSYPARTYLWKGTVPQLVSPKGEGAIELLLASARNVFFGRRNSQETSKDLLKEVSRWLVDEMQLAKTFEVKQLDNEKRFYELLVDDNPLIDVGFGVSQILPVIVLLFSVPEESIVLIEQPEIHLHPGAQAALADLFLYAAEKRNLQLIIESHSEHLLRRLQRRIAEREHELANPEHIKMYFCDTGQNGSTIETVKIDRFGQISNWPENFFGDIDHDLEQMTRAGLKFRRQELRANE